MSTLQKDMRVHILLPQLGIVPQGVIYRHCPSSQHPWCVRPDGWGQKRTGIAFKACELRPVEREVRA